MTTRSSRAASREAGASTIEVIGMIPVIVMILGVLIQTCAFIWTVMATDQAARDGARALSLSRSVDVAIEASLPGSLHAHDITAIGDTVTLQVNVPHFGFLPDMTVTRKATMPKATS
jgi:hypothetical protein